MIGLWQAVLLNCGMILLSYGATFGVALLALRWLRANPLHLQRALAALMARVTRLL